MFSMRTLKVALGVAASFALAESALVSIADAVVGRPLTPVSVGGVARRSTRRAVAYTSTATAAAATETASANAAAAQSAAAAQDAAAAANQAAAPAPTAMVASLPAGCVTAGAVFQCGNVYYKPFLSGTQVVYGVVPGP